MMLRVPIFIILIYASGVVKSFGVNRVGTEGLHPNDWELVEKVSQDVAGMFVPFKQPYMLGTHGLGTPEVRGGWLVSVSEGDQIVAVYAGGRAESFRVVRVHELYVEPGEEQNPRGRLFMHGELKSAEYVFNEIYRPDIDTDPGTKIVLQTCFDEHRGRFFVVGERIVD